MLKNLKRIHFINAALVLLLIGAIVAMIILFRRQYVCNVDKCQLSSKGGRNELKLGESISNHFLFTNYKLLLDSDGSLVFLKDDKVERLILKSGLSVNSVKLQENGQFNALDKDGKVLVTIFNPSIEVSDDPKKYLYFVKVENGELKYVNKKV